MNLKTILGLSVAGALAIGTSASARTLHTPLVAPDGDTQLLCSIINADDSREVSVRIEAVGFSGQVLDSSGELTIAPGQVGGINVAAGAGAQYCRFDLIQGSHRSVRASACLFEHGVGCVASTDAS